MKILYVVSRAIQINSSSSIRNLATVEGFVKLGHEVSVLSSMYDKNHVGYDEKLIPIGARMEYVTVGGIQKIAAVGRKYKSLGRWRKLVSKAINSFQVYDNLQGMCKCVQNIDITDDMYDVIISSSDPKSSHLVVYEMYAQGILKKTPWVQIWGDPFAADVTKESLIYRLRARKEERKLLQKADKVIYVSKLTKESQQEAYRDYASKMLFCPPAYVKEKNDVREQLNQPMKVVYCGNYSSSARNLKPFYEAMIKSKYDVTICGNGDIEIRDNDHLKHKIRCTFEEVEKIEKDADVVVYLCNKGGNQIPGKIYQYLGTDKYILFILDGEEEKIKAVFEPYERFVFCRNNEKDILSKLSQIEKGNYKKTRFVVKDFSAENRAADLLRQVGLNEIDN